MRRNEIGAHYSVLYIHVLHSIQYCSLFLQITVHSAHAQKRSWCSLQCTVTTALCSYRLLYSTQCACAETKLVLTTVQYTTVVTIYSTALCSYRLLYTVRMRRKEVGAHFSVLYTSIIQYCSLFLQLSVLCACAERKEVFSLQV